MSRSSATYLLVAFVSAMLLSECMSQWKPSGGRYGKRGELSVADIAAEWEEGELGLNKI